MKLRALLRPRVLLGVAALGLVVSTTAGLLVACASTSSVATPDELTTARRITQEAQGQLSPAAPGTPATSRATALAPLGYVEEELLLQGQARTYDPVGTWGQDGQWTVRARGELQPVATRVLVRRPQDPSRFNGVVLVEWLNTSLGLDLDGIWMVARDELIREGYAWVGVSAEAVGISQLQQALPGRYAQARLATSDLGFDLFTLTARLSREAALGWGTPGRTPQQIKVIGSGYSKSASYLISYVNAFQPLTGAFDGFYVRGATPAAIQVHDIGLNVVIPRWRMDMKVPVMQVQTEGEVKASWTLSRTSDGPMNRYWEIAGAVHFDHGMQQQALQVAEPWGLKPAACRHPTNTLPAHLVDHAALDGLLRWMRTGVPPAKVPHLQRNDNGWLVYSEPDGNVRGGIQLPQVSLNLARFDAGYTNWPTRWPDVWTGFTCLAGGATLPATQPGAASAPAVREAAQALVQQGVLKAADVDALVKQTLHAPNTLH